MQQQQQQQRQPSGGLWSQGKNKVKATRPEKLLSCMRIVNIILSVGVIIVAVSTMAALTGCDDKCARLSFGVICFFAIVFSVLLLLFECRVGNSAKEFIGKNFGFLYTHRGKAILIIFIGTMCFSAISTNLDRWWLNLLVGLCVTLNGVFSCMVYYCHPTLGEVDLKPQSKGLGGSSTGNHQSTTNATTAQATISTTSSSDYQYGETASASTYSQYNESPFVISDPSPQPPVMEANPYSNTVNTGGMPFSNETETTTVEVGGPIVSPYDTTTTTAAQAETNTNPFEPTANPFSEDSDQRV